MTPRTAIALFLLLALASGCASGAPAASPAPPVPGAPGQGASETAAQAAATASPTAEPTPTPDPLLALPVSFQYELRFRPAGVSGEPETVVAGRYAGGAFAQETRHGDAVVEELVVAPDPGDGTLRSYTRPAGEAGWTRWPGPGFDAGAGLPSPLAILRLYPLARGRTAQVLAPAPGAPEPTFRSAVTLSGATIARLNQAAARALALQPEWMAVVEQQLAPLAVDQTIQVWATRDGRVYRAAATLQARDAQGRPSPWIDAVWRYWDYDRPSLAVAAPQHAADAPPAEMSASPTGMLRDAGAPGADAAGADAASAAPAESAPADEALDPAVTLRVRVFAYPGVPAEELSVTVYPPGDTDNPVDWQGASDAQFALPPGNYDVLVQMAGAERLLRGIEITEGRPVVQDVVFDFGELVIAAVLRGEAPPVDIVVYPAGKRQDWVEWRTENPTSLLLQPGKYDVEVTLPDLTGTRSAEGIEVRTGETTEATIDLGK
jgi:hypothetical protein